MAIASPPTLHHDCIYYCRAGLHCALAYLSDNTDDHILGAMRSIEGSIPTIYVHGIDRATEAPSVWERQGIYYHQGTCVEAAPIDGLSPYLVWFSLKPDVVLVPLPQRPAA